MVEGDCGCIGIVEVVEWWGGGGGRDGGVMAVEKEVVLKYC